MNRKIIPIVFAINDNYVPYCGVAISSLMSYASDEYEYRLHVFYSELSDKNIRRLENMSTDNVIIKCMNVSNSIPDVKLKNKNHVSKETVYRIIAPIVLNEYDKILYLDSDMVILDDVSKIYNIDLGEHILGAVEEKQTTGFVQYLEERNIETKGYFNSGVLLLNTKQLIEKDILSKVVEVLNNDVVYFYPDQDSLNIVCGTDIVYLPGEWNVAWHLSHENQRVIAEHVDITNRLFKEYKILHYTSNIKAWQRPDLEYAHEFWYHARKTPFYEEIIFKNTSKPNLEPNPFARFIFPWSEIKADSKIIIYGAGVVGQAFVKQLEQTKFCTVLAVADKRKDEINNIKAPVILPTEIVDFNYDSILIAIENPNVASAIKEELISIGYDENMIKWASPKK